MDDCFRLVRAQEEEQKTALVIRICNAILGRFNRTECEIYSFIFLKSYL